jgi:hypothetical protein
MSGRIPGRLHVAKTRLDRLGCDHEYQDGRQQFHALIVINYCD